jgi:fibronectin type 3 domain-containing protein
MRLALIPIAVAMCFSTMLAHAQSSRPSPPSMETSAKPEHAQPPKKSGKHKPHSVQLKWQASKTKGIEGYYVYRADGKASGNFERITPRPIKVTKFTDKKVKAGKTYSYAVSAVQKIGKKKEVESERTPAITVQIPEP